MSEVEKSRAEREAKAKELFNRWADERDAARDKAEAERKAKEEADRKAAEEKKREEEDDELGVFGL